MRLSLCGQTASSETLGKIPATADHAHRHEQAGPDMQRHIDPAPWKPSLCNRAMSQSAKQCHQYCHTNSQPRHQVIQKYQTSLILTAALYVPTASSPSMIWSMRM